MYLLWGQPVTFVSKVLLPLQSRRFLRMPTALRRRERVWHGWRRCSPSHLNFTNGAHNPECGESGCVAVHPHTCFAPLSRPFKMLAWIWQKCTWLSAANEAKSHLCFCEALFCISKIKVFKIRRHPAILVKKPAQTLEII